MMPWCPVVPVVPALLARIHVPFYVPAGITGLWGGLARCEVGGEGEGRMIVVQRRLRHRPGSVRNRAQRGGCVTVAKRCGGVGGDGDGDDNGDGGGDS